MANEYQKPTTGLTPAVTNNLASSVVYNTNFAAMAKDSICGFNQDGQYSDFFLGDQAINGTGVGTFCKGLKMRTGSQLSFYDNAGNFVNNVNLFQATETSLGQAKIATQAEVDAGVNDTNYVTPLKYFNTSGAFLKFYTKITTSGVFTVPLPARFLLVTITGAGGGGGGGGGTGNGTLSPLGYTAKIIPPADQGRSGTAPLVRSIWVNSPLNTTYNVTIGAGGGGGGGGGNATGPGTPFGGGGGGGGGGSLQGQNGNPGFTNPPGGAGGAGGTAGGVTSFGTILSVPCSRGGAGGNGTATTLYTPNDSVGGAGGGLASEEGDIYESVRITRSLPVQEGTGASAIGFNISMVDNTPFYGTALGGLGAGSYNPRTNNLIVSEAGKAGANGFVEVWVFR